MLDAPNSTVKTLEEREHVKAAELKSVQAIDEDSYI